MPLGRPLYDPTRDTRIADHEYWIQRLKRRTTEIGAPVAGVAAESLYLDTRSTVTSTTVLVTGDTYIITVQGTYSLWNSALEGGTPEADAMFPTSGGGRISTEVGLDAECEFAWHTSGAVGHRSDLFQVDLGSGYAHIEPTDGTHSTPTANHLYTYSVTGQGSAVSFRVNDLANLTDNYGQLKITIQTTSAGSGGGSGSSGSGTLVPATDPTQNDYVLKVVGGVPTFSPSIDGGSA